MKRAHHSVTRDTRDGRSMESDRCQKFVFGSDYVDTDIALSFLVLVRKHDSAGHFLRNVVRKFNMVGEIVRQIDHVLQENAIRRIHERTVDLVDMSKNRESSDVALHRRNVGIESLVTRTRNRPVPQRTSSSDHFGRTEM